MAGSPASPPVIADESGVSAVSLAFEAARRLDLHAELLDPEHGHVFEVRDGARARTLVGGRSPLNDAVAARIAEDKHWTSVVLERAGIATPKSVRCFAPDHPNHARMAPEQVGLAPGLAVASRDGYPRVVKPNRLSYGRGVQVVHGESELREAVEHVWTLDAIALVQPVVDGRDLRLDFLDGEYLFGYERAPWVVTGDGERTLRALLTDIDGRLADDRFHASLVGRADWARFVAPWGGDPDPVLRRGETLRFASVVRNLHAYCRADLIETVPPGLWAHCARVGEAMGLRHYGIDLKVPAGADDRAVVIEVNASPLLVQMARSGHFEAAVAAQMRVLRAALA